MLASNDRSCGGAHFPHKACIAGNVAPWIITKFTVKKQPENYPTPPTLGCSPLKLFWTPSNTMSGCMLFSAILQYSSVHCVKKYLFWILGRIQLPYMNPPYTVITMLHITIIDLMQICYTATCMLTKVIQQMLTSKTILTPQKIKNPGKHTYTETAIRHI